MNVHQPLRLRGWIVCWLGVALVCLGAVETQRNNSKTFATKNAPKAQEIEVRGRVVCLPEAMHETYETDLPTRHEHVYGFKTVDGRFYTLLRTKLSEALFADKRLHEKELIIKGRTFPHTQILDAVVLRSVRNGVVNDLYYYCDVCEIKTVVPGPCMCCQAPVILVEKPIERSP